jgi:hypothetical protein
LPQTFPDGRAAQEINNDQATMPPKAELARNLMRSGIIDSTSIGNGLRNINVHGDQSMRRLNPYARAIQYLRLWRQRLI